ncbi:hypothetical protein CsatB_015911 [Cannabis sativa]
MEFESCSVIVPSVLEMTKDPNMVTVPSRYIQLEQDQDQANVDLNSSSEDFPVINFQNLSLPISHNSQLYQSELTKLHLACKNWGFFQLVNHNVSNSVVEKMKEEVKKLFELPIEEREKLWQRPGEVEGFGHTFVFNDEQKVNWKDDLFLFILPHALRNPNLFPKLPSSLSIEHRVVVNPKQERLSIATFLNPNLEYDIGPVSSLITQQNPPKYKTVTSKEYIKGVFSNEPDGKAYVDIMKLY